jgi:hypothetical protein
MNSSRTFYVITALLICLITASPVWAKKSLPTFNDEGMELVRDTELASVYTDPGVDLGIYKSIWLQDATVAFKKNWQRDQNRGHNYKIQTSDMEQIKQDVATIFREVFTQELLEAGYELVAETGAEVLKLKPFIVDLDVIAPDIQNAGRTMTFSESAGEMTLNLELYDSLTDDKIAKATDRKQDFRKGYIEWRTKIGNRAIARRMMKSWAIALRSTLDEARSSSANLK